MTLRQLRVLTSVLLRIFAKVRRTSLRAIAPNHGAAGYRNWNQRALAPIGLV